jgi:hypothetical protein
MNIWAARDAYQVVNFFWAVVMLLGCFAVLTLWVYFTRLH